jgi:hypothetical protein
LQIMQNRVLLVYFSITGKQSEAKGERQRLGFLVYYVPLASTAAVPLGEDSTIPHPTGNAKLTSSKRGLCVGSHGVRLIQNDQLYAGTK